MSIENFKRMSGFEKVRRAFENFQKKEWNPKVFRVKTESNSESKPSQIPSQNRVKFRVKTKSKPSQIPSPIPSQNRVKF